MENLATQQLLEDEKAKLLIQGTANTNTADTTTINSGNDNNGMVVAEEENNANVMEVMSAQDDKLDVNINAHLTGLKGGDAEEDYDGNDCDDDTNALLGRGDNGDDNEYGKDGKCPHD